MHIPDGFVSTPVAAVGIAIAAGSVAYAVKATNKKMGEKQVPLMEVLAAFIFAAQMLNFPIAGGAYNDLCAHCAKFDFPGWGATCPGG